MVYFLISFNTIEKIFLIEILFFISTHTLKPYNFQQRPDNLLDKIVKKEVPCEFLHEDDLCVAFDDMNPQAPCHFLVVPKKKIISLSKASINDSQLLGHMMIVAKQLAARKRLNDGYRVVINNGKNSVQFSGHLHLHVLGGRIFHWPPG